MSAWAPRTPTTPIYCSLPLRGYPPFDALLKPDN